MPLTHEDRIHELEARVAFQDNTIEQLDQVVRELGDQLLVLRREVKELRAQVREGGGNQPTGRLQDEVPPHY